MRFRLSLLIICMLLAITSTAVLAVPPRYMVTDLGTLGSDSVEVAGMNDSGQVVGYSQMSSGYTHAFLYTPASGMTDLGAIWGENHSYARGINNSGQVVGAFQSHERYGTISRGFLYTPGMGMTTLATQEGRPSYANDISDSGQVTGYYTDTSGYPHVFLYAAGLGVTDTGVGGRPKAINNLGQVVGNNDVFFNGYWVGFSTFLYAPGSGKTDLTTMGMPNDINDSGRIVGVFRTNAGQSHAFLYTSGSLRIDLGTLGADSSVARAINNSDQVVGYQGRAFLYNSDMGMASLNSLLDQSGLGWDLVDAQAINNRGQIAGWGFNPSGQKTAFLLTPVPEPSSLLAFGSGLLALGGLIRRRR